MAWTKKDISRIQGLLHGLEWEDRKEKKEKNDVDHDNKAKGHEKERFYKSNGLSVWSMKLGGVVEVSW